MHATDQVQIHHRVGHTQPHRQGGIATEEPRNRWNRPHDQCETGNGYQLVQHHAQCHVIAHNGGDHVANAQVQRAVWGGGIAPIVADLQHHRPRVD